MAAHNPEQNNVVSFSGGKDSTAVLFKMIEEGEHIHSAVFFDTGWEFPGMEEHVSKVRSLVSFPVVTLHPTKTFDHWMFEREIKARRVGLEKLTFKELKIKWCVVKALYEPDMPKPSRGRKGLIDVLTGRVHRIGNGWPSHGRRWCTRQKVDAIDRYMKTVPNPVACIGYALDEEERWLNPSVSHQKNPWPSRFPLVEYKMTEADALRYCLSLGFDWDGLYTFFRRVSCFCCPLQRIRDLRLLRLAFPDLWALMLDMDERSPAHNKGFMKYKTVKDMEDRFAKEELAQIVSRET